MDRWKELNDFSAWDAKIPCVLCKNESEKTLVGEHWKCSVCDHLFNKDGSLLPEAIICTCEICSPRKNKEDIENEEKGSSKIIKKAKELIKKLTSKKKFK